MTAEQAAEEKYPFRKDADDFTYPGSALNEHQRKAFLAGVQYAGAKEWISVEDSPLVTFNEKGWWTCTENGSKEFLAAVPYNDKNQQGKELWWIGHCVIEDKLGLCIVCDDDTEPAGWEIIDVTHYQSLPSPPSK